jgi:hypothetical protein
MRRLMLAVLLLIPSLAFADLSVSVKKAKSSVVTETTTIANVISQTTTEDGDAIGEAVVTPGTPSTTKTSVDKPVAVLIVKTDRPVGELLIRAKSKTCKPVQIEPGIYTVSEAGSHEVEFMAIGQNPLSWDEATVVVAVSPGPGPTPPGPGPSPTPGIAPIEGDGLRVLFVAETGERMPQSIEASFYSTEVAAYLNANCAKVGGQPDFRRVDPDTQFTDPGHRFAKALARPRASLPWLIISNGTSGYEGPFPATPAETLALIKSLTPKQSAVRTYVTLYSSETCPLCDKWKLTEKSRLRNVEIREVQDTGNVFQRWPSFVLQRGSKKITLSGYQTAEAIVEALGGLE